MPFIKIIDNKILIFNYFLEHLFNLNNNIFLEYTIINWLKIKLDYFSIFTMIKKLLFKILNIIKKFNYNVQKLIKKINLEIQRIIIKKEIKC